jgi:hypothetical protein
LKEIPRSGNNDAIVDQLWDQQNQRELNETMAENSGTKKPSNTRLVIAGTLSVFSLLAILYWGLLALEEPSPPAGINYLRPRIVKKAIQAKEIDLSPTAEKAPETTLEPSPKLIQNSGEFGLTSLDAPPEFVSQSSWTFKAQTNAQNITAKIDKKRLQFSDGKIEYTFKNMKDGPHLYPTLLINERGKELGFTLRFIVDTLAPTITVFNMSHGALSVKVGEALSGQVLDPHLKSFTWNGSSLKLDSAGNFSRRIETAGKQIVVLKGTDKAGHFKELKVFISATQSKETVVVEQSKEKPLPDSPAFENLPASQTMKFYGTKTCGSSGCHGGVAPLEERPGNEYTTWKSSRHAKAYKTLETEFADEIANQLYFGEARSATECLNCHSIRVPENQQGERYTIEDGVSCDGCHGPSGKWYVTHRNPKAKPSLPALGMWELKTMARRADVCLSCHGHLAPKFVEAGHPPLSFEIFTASQRQPSHHRARGTWDSARLWSAGLGMGIYDDVPSISKLRKQKEAVAVDLKRTQILHKLQLLQRLPENLKNLSSSYNPKRLIKRLKGGKELTSKNVSDLFKWAGKSRKLSFRLSSYKETEKAFDRQRIKRLVMDIVGDAKKQDFDGYSAEQLGGALFALYNSYYYGEQPRLAKPIQSPAFLTELSVRPGLKKPESLFKESGDFHSIIWRSRLRPIPDLFRKSPQRR